MMLGILRWAALLSPAFFLLSVLLPLGHSSRRRRWAWYAVTLLVAQTGADWFHWTAVAGAVALVVETVSAWIVIQGWSQSKRVRKAWLSRFHEAVDAGAMVRIALPFEGRWKASGTGPWIGRNHHLAAGDQWFAVDWRRVDGESFGSVIFAPADGVVAWVEDGHEDARRRNFNPVSPAGNHLSIRIARPDQPDAYLILAHLVKGSITVCAGQHVHAGQVVARCGNSGNTTVPHLHIHAQDRVRVAVGTARGLPLIFDSTGDGALKQKRSRWTRIGTVVRGKEQSGAEGMPG